MITLTSILFLVTMMTIYFYTNKACEALECKYKQDLNDMKNEILADLVLLKKDILKINLK
jgi:hypothetical protein